MTERVLVVAGGMSHERDVSVRSGRRVTEALRDVGVDAQMCDMDAELVPSLVAAPPDVVFPVLHGAAGEDGAIRGVFDALGVAYVGSGPGACRAAFDKPIAKGLVTAAGIATPESLALPHAVFRELGAAAVLHAVVGAIGLPLVVKPTSGGSSLGASVVHAADELPAAMVSCFAYGETALLERFIEGVEVAVSVVDLGEGAIALPAVEIVPDGVLYDYAARYTAGATEFFVPARLDDALLERIAAVALGAHEVLGARDVSRSDLIVDASGVVWFLEMNVAPGMTETSLLPQSVVAAGLDFGEVCASLVQRARARRAD
jgi:D-alanine-D-alanine ligase